MKITTLFLLAILTLPIFAQIASATLTDTERQQWAQFAQAEQQLQTALGATVEQARQLSASNAEQAVRFLAGVKEVYAALDSNTLQRALWLEKLRAARKCEGCVVSEDGKSFAKPPTKDR